MKCWSKIKPFLVVLFIILFTFILSRGEEYDYDFWKNLSEISVVILIFTISSLWAVRTSAFYSYAQGRNNFYQYMVDHKENYKWYKDKKKIIEDPASQYLTSARSFRTQAIIYNMMLFYLLLCIFFLFIQFLFNLKEGNITIWFWILLFVVGSVIFYLVYKVINEGTDYLKNKIKRLKKTRDFFPAEIGILIVLDFILLIAFSYVLWKNFCPQTILLEEPHWFPFHFKITVLSLINILLFSIASYLAYLSLRIFQSRSYDPFNGFLIWAHDHMDIIPSLQAKKGAGINPDVKKENKMINLWKWSLVLHLKKIFDKMDHNGNINEEHRKNEQHVENLIAALTASEWNDPSILYLSANVWKALGFLRIDNCPVICKKDQLKNKKRYQNAKEAAEKRWNELNEKLENLEKKKYPENSRKRQEIDCKINKSKKGIFYRKYEIKNLKKLLDKNNNIAKNINREEFNDFKSVKDEIKNICDALIEIYKDRTKN